MPMYDPVEKALSLYQAGEFDDAERLCESLARAEPDNPVLLNLIGVLAIRAGQPARAVTELCRAVALCPDEPQFLLNLAIALFNDGQLSQAATRLEQATKVAPDAAAVHSQLAIVRRALGDNVGAVEAMGRAVALDPANAENFSNLSVMLLDQGRLEEACAKASRAVELASDLAEAHYNLSVALRQLDRVEDAAASCRRALALNPNYWDAQNNLGCILLSLNEIGAAIDSLQQATKLSPVMAESWSNLGRALRSANRMSDAEAAYRRGLDYNPDSDELCAELEYLLRRTCNWGDLDDIRARLDVLTSRALAEGRRAPETPHAHITRSSDMARSLEIARSWADHASASIKDRGRSIAMQDRTGSIDRIKLGYISNNFRNHALSHLMRRVFALHDRTRFEVGVYSYGGGPGDEYTEQIVRDCDSFVDISEIDDGAAAARINDDHVDILVDLRGHGAGNRFAVVAQRIAPIQVHYLGFPGTTGSSTIDYFIGDATVCPAEARRYFSEALVIMPHSYQVNDDQQKISDIAPKRADFGLPQDAFVFCSFNGSYKLNPELFGVWTEILKSVPGGTLWLYSGVPEAETNLRRVAGESGVDPDRLVFSGNIAKAEHLARFHLANLALDTFPCNGHTTTSDALWAGVPVLTLKGQHFASNVTASLLQAVGLPELIAADQRAYIARAIEFAHDRTLLSHLCQSLQRNLKEAPLFNTALFVRDLEKAYQEMWRRHVAKESVREIDVRALD